ncbi:ABC transporter permease [Selenihalanaerobacter shriftii]|uniref:NitT/TauT family transport system permease protein n=1 Tax=Selenihalanaerobacter shriftii TaxID=142842 RepID=A0A1T4JKW4_9FIRM|nr:ABC transporter permease [Selenihalanaerobacter shriftii]SJZ30806.1 NitT/TauT family transport system permease protein [Selenihalanaerobacter shriftii]
MNETYQYQQQLEEAEDYKINNQENSIKDITNKVGKNSLRDIVINIIPIIGLFIIWHLIAIIIIKNRGVPFPTPLQTLVRFYELLRGDVYLKHTIYGHLLDSLIRWGTGFSLAAVIGMSIGVLIGWSKIFSKLIMPIVYILQPIPSLAWIPVAILLFGLGTKSTILIIFLASIFPIIINMAAGVKGVSKMYIRAAKMMGTNDRTLFLKVLLPAAIPHLLSGFRIGLANGWRALIAAEMIAATGSGVGYAIFQARWNFDYASAFVNIIVICIIGLTIERLIFTPIEKGTIEKWGMKRKED